MSGYTTLILGVLVLVLAVGAMMLIGRKSGRRLHESEIANDTVHPDAFVVDDGTVVHIDDVNEERF